MIYTVTFNTNCDFELRQEYIP